MKNKNSKAGNLPLQAHQAALPTNNIEQRPPSSGTQHLILLACIIVVVLFAFRALLSGDLLLTTDDNIGELVSRKRGLPSAFLGWWSDQILVGLPGFINFTWTYVLLWLLPAEFFNNWIHAIDLGAASFFFVLFLRRKGVCWPVCAVGALAAFWLASNFTLTYAGHLGKFGLLVFAAMYLWFAEIAIQTKRLSWVILAGFAMGGMFLEQPDVALFFAMPFGAYFVFGLVRDHGWRTPLVLKLTLPLVVVAFLMAARSLHSGYTTNVAGISVLEEDPKAKWEFITQWSWPPEECLDFVAPGYTGWRSGEPEGAYRGRMGRSAGWEQTGQGFQNFKLENQYMGASVVAIGILAFVLAWRFRKSVEFPSRDLLFWGGVSLITLLLAFGKYFPLYALFAKLPAVSTIRNPNKFLQVFQVAFAVLGAIGLDAILKSRGTVGVTLLRTGAIRKALIGIFLAGGLLLVAGLMNGAGFEERVQALAGKGWGGLASNMQRVKVTALVYGGVMLVVTGFVLRRILRSESVDQARKAAWILVGLLLVDVGYLAGPYVKTVDRSFIENNVVTDFLQDNLGPDRVVALSQESFYNHWLTYLFPYYGFNKVNVTQMSRMPADYDALLKAVNNPFRQWQMFAVAYAIGPAAIYSQIAAGDQTKDVFTPQLAFNVYADGDSVKAVSATQQNPGQHVVLKFNLPALRYVHLGNFEVVEDEEALRRFSTPEYVPYQKLFVSPDTSEALPSPTEGISDGKVNVHHYKPGRVKMQVSASGSGILRIAEKYDPGWKAFVDGVEVRVRRCDFLFMGVDVAAGIHEVELKYQPANPAGILQLSGMALSLVALVSLAKRKHPITKDDPDEAV